MSLENLWQEHIESIGSEGEQQAFFRDYYLKEQNIYEQLLAAPDTNEKGVISGLAEKYNMELPLFAGFLEGIQDSLHNSLDLSKLDEASEIELDIDYEKLYFNMLEAKASWLYELEQWDGILSEDKRKAILKDWRASKMAISEKVDRNAPCPCGSGKKYKKCCGA